MASLIKGFVACYICDEVAPIVQQARPNPFLGIEHDDLYRSLSYVFKAPLSARSRFLGRYLAVL